MSYRLNLEDRPDDAFRRVATEARLEHALPGPRRRRPR